jgi:hypothetical protein
MIIRRIPRSLKFWWQRRTRGFGDDELWNLDSTIARFVLPRFRAFRRDKSEWHVTDAQYEADLTEIEWALEKMASHDWPNDLEPADHDRCERALALFGKHLWSFWT